MKDRGIIKWQPFNSLINQKQIIEELNTERCKKSKPLLSSDQYEYLEAKINEHFACGDKIKILYYYKGQNYKVTGEITKIDKISNKIILNNQTSIFFYQIISIYP